MNHEHYRGWIICWNIDDDAQLVFAIVDDYRYSGFSDRINEISDIKTGIDLCKRFIDTLISNQTNFYKDLIHDFQRQVYEMNAKQRDRHKRVISLVPDPYSDGRVPS
jgi:hypothetical protein